MKRSFAIILITGCLVLAGSGALAQNAALQTKPGKSTVNTGSSVNSVPAAPTVQISNEQQNAKPIVPGGEFKPMDTRMPQKANDKDNVIPNPLLPPAPQVNLQTPPPVKTREKKPVPVQQQPLN